MTVSMKCTQVDESSNRLTCTCRKCVVESIPEHQHEVKDYHPEIKWKTSQAQKKEEIRGIMKSYNCNYERALKIYNGEIKNEKTE